MRVTAATTVKTLLALAWTSSSCGQSKKGHSDDLVEEVPSPMGTPKANAEGSHAGSEATASVLARAQEPVPARKKAKAAAGPATSSGKPVMGRASPASSKKKTLSC